VTFFIPYALNTLKMNKLQTPSSLFTFAHRTIDYQQLRYDPRFPVSHQPKVQPIFCNLDAEWTTAIVEDTVIPLLPNERGAKNHQSPEI
jgi:hypothetical protein